MIRRSLVTVCALVLLAGCQDYNFNPVGKCVIQPGSARIRIANLSTADILFVVDDSGSMQSKQDRLANNFKSFIDQLAVTQKDRASNALDPLEFHIAVTTSSVFEGRVAPGTSCNGTPLTCNVSNPVSSDQGPLTPFSYACTTLGAQCAELVQNYHGFGTCSPGVGAAGKGYPSGDFVAAGSNPKVLHFTKDLNWATWNTTSVDPKLDTLVQQFKANINVGTCGSGMEQHLEAGRLALQKALRQNGLSQVVDASEWPHPGAKLVVVWVGDEDDCSSPNDPAKGIFFTTRQDPGADACTDDEGLAPELRKMFPVDVAEATGQGKGLQSYADYFTSLGRPFGAAFIYSATPSSCAPDGKGNITCTPGTCSCIGSNDASCGGFAAGTRLKRLSAALIGAGVTTLEASVCDLDFASTLQGIADLVKPPAGLTLPSQPAASEVAVLRIESADAATSRQCRGPALTSGDKEQNDWWFIAAGPTGRCVAPSTEPVSAPTSCIFINHATRQCEPNPGETYIAQYLGMV
ncbi:MAG: hypothetical protein ACJ79E_10240, partial [Anaeromyxobacteraceae bacterium]